MRVALTLPILFCSLLTQSAYALMCTKTYAQVQTGMTVAQVQAACGKPKSVQKKRRQLFETQTIQYWSYSSNEPDKRTATAMRDLGYVSEPKQSKQFTIDQNGKVSSISVGGGVLDSTAVCGGLIRVGDPGNVVASYCGQPDARTRGTKRVPRGSVESEVWTYQFDQFRPPVVLTFEKGVLVNINE